jgi:hypothetical protein
VFEEPLGPLWVNGHHTYHGTNDKVPAALADGLRSSLRLIRVPSFRLSVFAPREVFGDSKKRVQAQFIHDGMEYALWVTDPRYERVFLGRGAGQYERGNGFLTISLGERYLDNCHKLVAAIIERPVGKKA